MNMKNKLRFKQKGMGQLVTALVGMGVTVVIISMLTPYIASTLDQHNKIEGESNLQLLSKSVESWYQDNAWYIDSNGSSELKYKDNSAKEYEIKSVDYSDQESIKKIAKKYNGNDNVVLNGFKSPFSFFVSDRLSVNVDNVLVPYHLLLLLTKVIKLITNQPLIRQQVN